MKIDGNPDDRPVYPHPDCAVCVHWYKREGKCLRNRDPKKLGPYQACMYCNTDPCPDPKAKKVQGIQARFIFNR